MSASTFFYEHPVFRHEEFAAWKMANSEVQPASINTALQYYVTTGRIKLIRRKLYATIPPNQSPENVAIDPYLIAGKVTDDAILGYHTALELMGFAYSTFSQFTYITQQKSKPFGFQESWFQPVATSVALPKKWIGVEQINRQGIKLNITNPARTFVDMLNRIELCGGWEEVCRSIHYFSVLDVDEVIAYCLLLKNARLNATVGYFLSQRKDAFSVTEKKLNLLLKAVPIVPQYASKKTQEKFQLVKPWNIFLPVSVIHQSWEEPDVAI